MLALDVCNSGTLLSGRCTLTNAKSLNYATEPVWYTYTLVLYAKYWTLIKMMEAPDMLPRDSAPCPKTASRPPERTGRGSKISRWREEGPTPSGPSCLPFALLTLPSDGPELQAPCQHLPNGLLAKAYT